jgi:hypothetical protein
MLSLCVPSSVSDFHRLFLPATGERLSGLQVKVEGYEPGGDRGTGSLGRFSATGYVGREVSNQTFFSISLDRNTETLTRMQRVPAQEVGISAQWLYAVGRRQNLVAGAEAHAVPSSEVISTTLRRSCALMAE